MRLFCIILISLLDVVPSGKAFLNPLQQRDSILIADQLEYGFRLDSLEDGTEILLPDFKDASNDTLTLVRSWQIDTVRTFRKIRKHSIRGSIVVSPFEEGKYMLPSIPVLRNTGGRSDTLVFEGVEVEVKTIPVDTATFEMHDIKGQIRYPLTFREAFPWIVGAWLLAAALIFAIAMLRKRRNDVSGKGADHREPAYIVALRQLDKYRGDKYWNPEKQKQFYSGITDALKFYIDERFGIDAPEMTTAELFSALKREKNIMPEMYNDLKTMFECADFVKFAKFIASDEDNAKALPLAVRFVTTTYQTELEEEHKDVL